MWWSWKANGEADVQFEKWDGAVLSNIATVISLESRFEGIIASHVLRDWDTTSLPCSRVNTMILNVLCWWRTASRMNSMRNLVRIDVTDGQLMQISRKLFLTHYVHKKSSTLNIARCAVFKKHKKPPQPPKNQPPTECNAVIHVLSVHGQCHLWKGADKPDPPIVDIRLHGWEMKGGVTTPVIYAAPTASQKLLAMVSWQCGIQINKTWTTGRSCPSVH